MPDLAGIKSALKKALGIAQNLDIITSIYTKTAETSIAEDLQEWKVSDDAAGYIKIHNQVATDGVFRPRISALSSDNGAQRYVAYITAANDTGTIPIITMDASRTGDAAVTTRPLFAVRNVSTSHLIVNIASVDFTNKSLINIKDLKIRNPADTFDYLLVGSAITGNRTASLPLLTANDVFMFQAHPMNITGVKRFQDAMLSVLNPALSANYFFRSSAITANTDVTLPLLAANDVLAFEGHPATLASKTLTTPVINGHKYADAVKTTAYTLTTTDSIIRANAASGGFTLTLPAASGNAGLIYTIIRTDSGQSTNLLTVDPNASETIDGKLAYILYPGESIIIECDGTGWTVLKANEPSVMGYYYEKGSTANRRYVAGLALSNTALITSTTGPTVNTLYAMPFIVQRITTFDTISCNITTAGAGSNCRLGIYRDNGNCYPGALLYDTGNISSASAGLKSVNPTADVQIFQPGLYWLTYENSATVPQVRALPGSGYIPLFPDALGTALPGYCYTVAHTVGALPDPYTAGATIRTAVSAVGSPIPAVGLRPI